MSARELQAWSAETPLEDVTIQLVEGDIVRLPPTLVLRRVDIEAVRPITLREFAMAEVHFEAVEFRNVSFSHGTFDRSTFRDVHFGSNLGDTRAVPVRFEAVTFRGCTFDWTNFKNATFITCNLKGSSFSYCDFYHARLLDGCVLESAQIENSSLWRADVTGSDLSRVNVAGPDGNRPLLQEQPEAFATYHAGKNKTPDDDARRAALEGSRQEAIEVYASLAGHFATRGNGADEAWAFVRRKKLEMQQARVDRRWLRYFGHAIAWTVTGFGESLGRIAATGVALALTVSLVFWLGYGQPWYLALAIGISGLFGSRPSSMPESLVDNLGADLILVTETVFGIVLVGLFGFILGNKIRGR